MGQSLLLTHKRHTQLQTFSAHSYSNSLPLDSMSNASETSSEFDHRVYKQRNFPHAQSFLTDADAKASQQTISYTMDDMKLNYKVPQGYSSNLAVSKTPKPKKKKWLGS